MAAISEDDERSIDWDWFAVDESGHIGHFTTAGLRLLPRSVKADEARAKSLLDFFNGLARETTLRVCLPIAEHTKGIETEAGRERYLRSFVQMGAKGLFSFDTQMLHGRGLSYFKVIQPDSPVLLGDLPRHVQTMLPVAPTPLRFSESAYIAEHVTLMW